MNFNLNLNSYVKHDKTQSVRLKISTSENDIQYISTNISVKKTQWNKRKQEIVKHPIEEKLNIELQSILTNVKNIYYKNTGVSASRLKEIIKNKSKYNSNSFLDFYQKIIDEMILKGSIRTAKTNQHYLDKLVKFQSFVSFSDLSPTWAKDYEKFMLNRNNKTNTIASNFKGINAALNKAVKLNLIDSNPLKSHEIVTENVEKTSLTLNEIETLIEYDIHKKNKGMIKARDMFLFSFYTAGMRFTDMCKLKWSNVKDNDIEYTMNKSSKRAGSRRTIPLNPKSLAIIERYKTDDEAFIFPALYGFNDKSTQKDIEYKIYITNNSLNRSLKTLANKCGIKKSLSMHMGKHSFADYAVKNEVDLLLISKLLGHTKLTTTQHYLKDFYHKEESDTMNKLFG